MPRQLIPLQFLDQGTRFQVDRDGAVYTLDRIETPRRKSAAMRVRTQEGPTLYLPRNIEVLVEDD